MKRLLFLVPGFALAFTPYFGYINFSKSLKKDAYIVGVYHSKFIKNVKAEIDLEHTRINYKYNIKEYLQNDLSLMFNIYRNYKFNYKIGYHYIRTHQSNNTDIQHVFKLGFDYYRYLKFNSGFNIYYSKYHKFNVYQISPHFGFNFGNYNSKIGSFYTNLKINYIKISKKQVAEKDNYINYDLSLKNYNGKFTTSFDVSLSKNSYKVDKDGLVVYNLSNEYKNSYGLSISYFVNYKFSFKTAYKRSFFKDSVSNNAKANIYSLSFNLNF